MDWLTADTAAPAAQMRRLKGPGRRSSSGALSIAEVAEESPEVCRSCHDRPSEQGFGRLNDGPPNNVERKPGGGREKCEGIFHSGHLGAGGSDAARPSALSLCALPTTSARVPTRS